MNTDEPLEQSHADVDLDPEAVEAKFADHHHRLEALEALSSALPGLTERPPLMRNRITGEGRFIRISDVCDDGRAEYADGSMSDDEPNTMGVVDLFPQVLEPIPEADEDVEALKRDGAFWHNHARIYLDARNTAERELAQSRSAYAILKRQLLVGRAAWSVAFILLATVFGFCSGSSTHVVEDLGPTGSLSDNLVITGHETCSDTIILKQGTYTLPCGSMLYGVVAGDE